VPAGIQVRSEGGGRFVLEGELDLSNVEQVAEVLWAPLRAGSPPIVDLFELAYMDSQGLRLFLELAAHAEEAGLGPLVLLNPSPGIRRLLDIAMPNGAPGLAVRDDLA